MSATDVLTNIKTQKNLKNMIMNIKHKHKYTYIHKNYSSVKKDSIFH